LVDVDSPEPVPPGLLAAFWRYDDALLADDRAVLSELFLAGEATLRGDGRNLHVGHDAISGYRSARSVIPTRAITRLYVRVLTAGHALIMAGTADGTATGLQTQLWRLTKEGWRVAAAHVTPPTAPPNTGPSYPAPPAFDTSVWRVVGAPLAAPLGSGPLDGYGVAVKDLFAVAGQPVGAGVPAFLTGQPPRRASAWAVSALQRAGAQLTGIGQTDEFAYSIAGRNAHYGAPPNPAAPARLGGGSSSGPAAAVALGQARVGLGTDTAGSIRIPASYQGLVGFRPTHGAVSTEGVLPLAPSFDTVGWLTRNVADSQAAAGVLLPPAADVTGPPVRLARLIRLPEVERLADPDVQELAVRQAGQASAAGLLPPADEVSLPPQVVEEWFAAFRTVQAHEAWQSHGAWISAHPGALGADVAARFAAAAAVTAEEAAGARVLAAKARSELTRWLDGAVLVLPTAPGPAPLRSAGPAEIDAVRGRTLRMSCLAPLAGAPAVSLPLAGRDAPVGLCLISAPGTDAALLALAAGLEAGLEAASG
jgi:Asp-tRNA(Asn)/Glu-tRNA(Gln) amidotransferase A subunit family amidase